METENKSVIEKFILKLTADKCKLSILIFGIISVICSIFFLVDISPAFIVFIFVMCMMGASILNIIYAVDVNHKNKNANNLIVLGTGISLLGFLLRTIQLGCLFSLQYFIAYFLYALISCMLMLKLSRNQGSSKAIIVMLILLSGYDVIEFFSKDSVFLSGFFWKIYHLAEVALFIQYICILVIHRRDENRFGFKLSKYCAQVPGLKICVIILVFIAVISIAIGLMVELNNNSSASSKVTSVTAQPEKTEENIKENKAKGTVNKPKSSEVEEVAENQESQKTAIDKNIAEIVSGQLVATSNCEFILNKVEFSHDVIPDTPPRFYTHYPASEGQVYIYVNASVKNTQKTDLSCDEIYSVMVDYDNGYSYTGQNIVEDEDGDFTYASINSVAPLQTMGVHCIIDCPEEVETSEKPLFLIIKFKDGTEYKYNIR